MRQFLLHRWFLLALVGVIVIGARFSAPLAALLALLPRSWESALIAAMMFLMALPLEAGAMVRALRRPMATLLDSLRLAGSRMPT
jgi:predicted Na+-dependent transporter